MGVRKTYSYAEVESAIDNADHQYMRKMIRVRSTRSDRRDSTRPDHDASAAV